ncbi:bifunctional hydroxymethylpyrimidine kinase/phosphomethylpyrimidine kinase [[Clostridium] polysaccharolyticum]|uniref:Hydroxymethylpyrimidine/phosphomethylpyrimidine kinase n=1 Tax=[Clostridium] polysaccharolyticum TaxID=29364 RepID=A0A1I0G7H3_9FIRM|nr:hydroxymethylpyrimidine/phosphomethylpyrimidine kinase [[Clostridium] polysaccharolyticum]
MKKILTIAGSDSSGGAGVQADIKTITVHKMYAMTAITAMTAQNTTGVFGIMESTPDFLESQLDSVFTDIFPDAVKIGMVPSAALIKSIVKKLKQYNAKNIVVDPVMIATSGNSLVSENTMQALCNELIPAADIITPNLFEAQSICNFEIRTKQDVEMAARKIKKNFKGTVVIKGGHFDDSADDLILYGDKIIWLKGKRIDNSNTHGTGCTLSSAIACNLAQGNDPVTSVKRAKEYLTGAISDGLNLGKGSGPLNHCYKLKLG